MILEAFPEHLDFLSNFFDCSRRAWNFSETNAVRALQLECLLYRFFLIFVHTETLPLCVNAVYRAAGEDAALNYKAPVGRVLGSATRVVLDHFKYFYDFAQAKLGSRERQLLMGHRNRTF